MKKVKSLMAVAVAVSVTLSATVPVFAVNAPGRFATPEPLVLAPVVADVEEEVTATVEAPIFANLAHTSRTFIDNNRIPRGTYPVLANAAQNPDFARLNRVFHNNVFAEFQNHAVTNVIGSGLRFHASFTVEDHGQFAVITQTMERGNMNNFAQSNTVAEFVFFIDKATNRQSTEEVFNAYLEAQEEVEVEEPAIEEADYVEEVPVEEVVAPVEEEVVPTEEEVVPATEEVEAPEVIELVPLALLEDLGFEVLVDEEYDLVVVNYDGAFIFSFTVGNDYITVGDEAEVVELPMATAFENGYIVIPSCVITQFLGLELPQYPVAEEDVVEEDEEEAEEEVVAVAVSQ